MSSRAVIKQVAQVGTVNIRRQFSQGPPESWREYSFIVARVRGDYFVAGEEPVKPGALSPVQFSCCRQLVEIRVIRIHGKCVNHGESHGPLIQIVAEAFLSLRSDPRSDPLSRQPSGRQDPCSCQNQCGIPCALQCRLRRALRHLPSSPAKNDAVLFADHIKVVIERLASFRVPVTKVSIQLIDLAVGNIQARVRQLPRASTMSC